MQVTKVDDGKSNKETIDIIYGGRGVNVWPNLRTRHEPDMGFFRLGLGLNGFGS